MRIQKDTKKKVAEKKVERTILTVEQDVKIPGTKIILEKGDKVEVMTPLEEDTNVSVSINLMGVDGSFSIEKGMDYVLPEGGEGEPEEVMTCSLNGSLNFNIGCGNTTPEVSAIEEAVKAFVNKFAAENVE